MSITLRDYQRRQLEFLKNHLEVTNTASIQSPTGSGKTYTILALAQEYLSRPNVNKVVISTGFNNLVFLMEERAKTFGFDNPIILIGKSHANCSYRMKQNNEELKTFTNDTKYLCNKRSCKLYNENIEKLKKQKLRGNKLKWDCPYKNKLYQKTIAEIQDPTSKKLIITNHSTLLTQQNLLDCDLLIIDEAHTFSSFYESYRRIEIDSEDLQHIDSAISNIKEPMRTIIQMNIENGKQLKPQQFEAIANECNNFILANKVRNFFGVKSDISNYIEYTDNSWTLDKFYSYYDLNINGQIVLFSATIDNFTTKMFNVSNNHQYVETKQFIDYSKSEFVGIKNDNFVLALKSFLKYVDNKGLKSGVVLSTTLTDVKNAISQDGYLNYKFYTKIKDFEKADGKKILVGSRRFFQGIDIQNLQFVALNKIPFPCFGDKAQAQQTYLTEVANEFDPWNDWTIPNTENSIIQATGRLWRSLDDFGVVSIFDSRLTKFKYIIKHTMYNYRHGIDIKLLENGEATPWDVK